MNYKLIFGVSFVDGDVVVGVGIISISMGGESFDVIIVGGLNNILLGIWDVINEVEDNFGVIVSILNYSDGVGGMLFKLVFIVDESGVVNNIIVVVSGDFDGNDVDNVGLFVFVFSDVNNGNMDEKLVVFDVMLLLDGEYFVISVINEFFNVI